MTLEVLRTRGLPFSLMTTTRGLLIIADGANNDLFTYCPQFGVTRGLGDFEDRPHAYTPKCLQLFDASIEELQKMKREWEAAAEANNRYDPGPQRIRGGTAPLPFIPALGEAIALNDSDAGLQPFKQLCDEIEMEEAE